MTRQENPLERVRVASPCPASWEGMSGDDKVRFCDQCQLHVYDISRMTRRQAESLIAHTEGRICARLYRRVDGTILTKDCPVGLRALRRRVAKVAGAAFTALLSLSASVLGQTFTRTTKQSEGDRKLTITQSFLGLNPQQGRATFWGNITDPAGAVIPGAQATIINEKTKFKRTIETDEEGQFKFGLLEPGLYTLKIESPGFSKFQQQHLNFQSNEDMRLDVILEPAGTLMGIIICEEPLSKGITIDGVRVRINE